MCHVCACAQRSEEGIRSSGAGVTGDWEPPSLGAGNHSDPLEEQDHQTTGFCCHLFVFQMVFHYVAQADLKLMDSRVLLPRSAEWLVLYMCATMPVLTIFFLKMNIIVN